VFFFLLQFDKRVNYMVKDPVCGTEVNEKSKPYYIHYKDETLFFCSKICKQSYDMSDEKDQRSWRRKQLDRIIKTYLNEFERVPSKHDHEGRAGYSLCQHEFKLSKTDMAFDPVCQYEAEKGNSPATRKYKGTTYYFCTFEYCSRFDESSERYTGGMKGSSLSNEYKKVSAVKPACP
jgi:YHS domain-containing protein